MRIPAFLLLAGCVTACMPGEYMTCVSLVNAQKVPFDSKILNVVLNITSEAMLLKTCRAYQNALPCFEQRFSVCGTNPQRQLLATAKRMYSFLCAPFSLQRQKVHLRRVSCIQNVLREPINGKCAKGSSLIAKKVASCRAQCSPGDNSCLAKVDISELAVCVVLRVEEQCGVEAAQFYTQLQQVILDNEYPLQCKYSINKKPKKNKNDPKKIGIPKEPLHSSGTEATALSTPFREKIIENMKKNPSARSGVRRVDPRTKTQRTNQPTFMHPLITKYHSAAKLNNVRTFSGARPIPNIMHNDFALVRQSSKTPITWKSYVTTTRAASTQKPINGTVQLLPWLPNPKQLNPTTQRTITTTTAITSVAQPILPVKEDYTPAINKSHSFNPLFVYRPRDSPTSNDPKKLPTSPVRIQINWVDSDAATTKVPPSQKQFTTRQMHDATEKDMDIRDTVEEMMPNLDFDDLSNKASSYFNAAVSALEETAQKPENDAWSKIAGIVAPALQKISPKVITKLKDSLDKFNINNTTHPTN